VVAVDTPHSPSASEAASWLIRAGLAELGLPPVVRAPPTRIHQAENLVPVRHPCRVPGGVMGAFPQQRFWQGLPEVYLDAALLWTTTTETPGLSPRRQGFPSWSWSGWIGEADMPLGSDIGGFYTEFQSAVEWYLLNSSGEVIRLNNQTLIPRGSRATPTAAPAPVSNLQGTLAGALVYPGLSLLRCSPDSCRSATPPGMPGPRGAILRFCSGGCAWPSWV
jgi:hypothetical protein